MAESHSEDSPLLDSNDPSSFPGADEDSVDPPRENTTYPPLLATPNDPPRGSITYRPLPATPNDPPRGNTTYRPLPATPNEEAEESHNEEPPPRRLQIPPAVVVAPPGVVVSADTSSTPSKSVHSQTSLDDSGCECDEDSSSSQREPSSSGRLSPPLQRREPPCSTGRFSISPPLQQREPCSTGRFSVLPPMQQREPCSTGRFSPPLKRREESLQQHEIPGPSSGVSATFAHESSGCHCGGGVPKRCICNKSCLQDVSVGGGEGFQDLILTHTDRGELQIPLCKVSFCIGYEDNDDRHTTCPSVTMMESTSQSGSEPGDEFRELVRMAPKSFPRVTSYSKNGMLSASSSTASMPMCRICHFPQGDGVDLLISPCRCSGTMQFIHESCLSRWLEISSKRKKAATCELCFYQFNRHKKFKLRHWQLPTCSRLDKILHSVFLLCLLVMATCATVTVYCFKQERFVRKREDTDLTKSEIVTLTCGVLFFVAFFMAMYVEVKAKDTLYRLFSKFLYLNQTWHIDEYDKIKDRQNDPV